MDKMRLGINNSFLGFSQIQMNLYKFSSFKSFSTSESTSPTSVDSSESAAKPEFNFKVDKKKIFNKKTHFRNLEIDNELDPTKSLQEQDERELTDWHKKKLYDKKYIKIHEDWQKNLMRKKKKKAITKHNYENYVRIF